MPRVKICPSILNADLANLQNESQKLLNAGGDYLHVDVMDGHFVPNITFGAPVVKCLHACLPDAFLDVHLMVSKPEMWITDMANAGANIFTFHIEATDDAARCIKMITAAGMKVGVALKPGTPVEVVEALVDEIDVVLIMTVEPGFGGQSFMHEMMSKVRRLRQLRSDLDIEVDGGVGLSTIEAVAEAGANLIVSGSAIVKSVDPRDTIAKLRAVVEKAQA